MSRSGAAYTAGLDDGRIVYLGDKAVDVAREPAFAGSIRGMAGYFDWQQKHADTCVVADPETGEPMNVSHLITRNPEDLARRHRGLEQLARYSYGMLGRTPDYVNTSLAGHVARKDLFAKADSVFHERITRFRREVIDRDLSLTHTIVHASIDRTVGELEGMNSGLTLKLVKRDSNGITVRGAKILATLGPFADENHVYLARHSRRAMRTTPCAFRSR